MLLTDAASAMKSLGELLKEQYGYQKILHVLCMAHAMHNVIGTIRKCYNDVDDVIMGIKDLFSNSHTRVSTFKQIAPGTKLPPAPVVTRFGKWLEASAYYADDKTREIVVKVLKKILEQKSKGKQLKDVLLSLQCICILLTKNAVVMWRYSCANLTQVVENLLNFYNTIDKRFVY